MNTETLQSCKPQLASELLHKRLINVLEFAAEHVQRLSSYASHWTEDVTESDEVVRLEDKILAETAILILLALRVKDLGVEARRLIDRLTELLEQAQPSERSAAMLLRCPHFAPALGLPQVILGKFGKGSPELQQIIERIFAVGLAETFERTPFRALEVRWIESLLNPAGDLHVADLMPLNVLLRPVHPITLNRTTAYAMTHGVMYATDFGVASSPLSPESNPEICARIDAALAWLLVNEDLDLLIEFIIASTVLREPWSPYVSSAWSLVNGVWDELGFLPSPSFNPTEYVKLQDDAAAAYVFLHVYHTMYVAGLLCAILLTVDHGSITRPWTAANIATANAAEACLAAANRGRVFISAPPNGNHPPTPQIIESPEEALARVASLVSELVPEHRRWRTALFEADLEPALLAQILGDAAIIHAARNYDLPKLLRAMDAMITLPRPPSLTLTEGAMFLVRQQFKDGCIGTHFVAPESRRSDLAREATGVISECLEVYTARFMTGC